VTLIYLALQIRQNSATTRAHIRQSLAESQIEYINLRATDPFLRGALQKMFSGQELDEDEAFGLRIHAVAGLRMFENYFAQKTLGTMDPEDWRAMREVLKGHCRFAAYQQAFAVLENSWNARFAAEVELIMEEINGPTPARSGPFSAAADRSTPIR